MSEFAPITPLVSPEFADGELTNFWAVTDVSARRFAKWKHFRRRYNVPRVEVWTRRDPVQGGFETLVQRGPLNGARWHDDTAGAAKVRHGAIVEECLKAMRSKGEYRG